MSIIGSSTKYVSDGKFACEIFATTVQVLSGARLGVEKTCVVCWFVMKKAPF